MTEVRLFTQETCGACATQGEKNEGIEDAYPDVVIPGGDIQTIWMRLSNALISNRPNSRNGSPASYADDGTQSIR